MDLKELAATNDSHKYLPLLLMGSGKTRSDAIAGLVALKHNSKALALLLSLQSWYGVAAATPDPDPQTKEFINDMETIFDLKEKNGILTGQISTITGALEHLKLTDVERQIIANKIVTMTTKDFGVLLKGERAVLDFFGLRPEPPKTNGNGKDGKK